MNNIKFKLFHAKPTLNGSALSLEVFPADTDHGIGHILCEVAAQNPKAIAGVKGQVFDFDNAARFALSFAEITEVLQVFRGEKESVADDRGFCHRTPGKNVVIKFSHRLEPWSGYLLECYEKIDREERPLYFFFNPAEALGVSIAIENMLGAICFGVPK